LQGERERLLFGEDCLKRLPSEAMEYYLERMRGPNSKRESHLGGGKGEF